MAQLGAAVIDAFGCNTFYRQQWFFIYHIYPDDVITTCNLDFLLLRSLETKHNVRKTSVSDLREDGGEGCVSKISDKINKKYYKQSNDPANTNAIIVDQFTSRLKPVEDSLETLKKNELRIYNS